MDNSKEETPTGGDIFPETTNEEVKKAIQKWGNFQHQLNDSIFLNKAILSFIATT